MGLALIESMYVGFFFIFLFYSKVEHIFVHMIWPQFLLFYVSIINCCLLNSIFDFTVFMIFFDEFFYLDYESTSFFVPQNMFVNKKFF